MRWSNCRELKKIIEIIVKKDIYCARGVFTELGCGSMPEQYFINVGKNANVKESTSIQCGYASHWVYKRVTFTITLTLTVI